MITSRKSIPLPIVELCEAHNGWYLLSDRAFARRCRIPVLASGDQISIGTDWASQVCSLSSTFCHNPEYLAYAGGAMLVIAIGVKLGSLAN